MNPPENQEHSCFFSTDPPTKITLSTDRPTQVTEDQLITFRCTVESFPLSDLTLTRSSTEHPQSPKVVISQPNNNTLEHSFNVKSTDTGFYTCDAKNREGSNKSTARELEVKCE